ncbi:MAG: helix-turn-helix transcriptional regulator [Paracoccaceae bacterium]
MSVLQVFGDNLRFLCSTRGSQTSVAAALGIGKVQFQRYLKGQSFPKPNLLKQVCDFFGVDARILTERIDPITGEFASAGKAPGPPPTAMAEVMSYACPRQDYFPKESVLEDGLYIAWRNSLSREDMVVAIPFLVKTLHAGRVVRGLDPKVMFASGAVRRGPGLTNPREFRGALMESHNGCSIVFFHSEPVGTVTHVFVAPNIARNDGRFIGFASTGRREYPGLRRMSRLVLIPAGRRMGDAVRVARQVGFYEPGQIEPSIREELARPLG